MKNVFFISGAVLLLFSCNKKNSNAPAKVQSDNKPQVIDTLKNKSAIEVLKLKYGGKKGELKAHCQLQSEKVVVAPEATAGLLSAGDIEPVIQYPEEDSFIYNLRTKLAADPELSEKVDILLSHEKDGALVELKMKISPVHFEPQLGVNLGDATYVMKHTPVLDYTYEVKLSVGEQVNTVQGEGKIFERIPIRKQIGKILNGSNSSERFLNCSLERQ